MVYCNYELRWSSSDNTLKEPDASGSFFGCPFFLALKKKEPLGSCVHVVLLLTYWWYGVFFTSGSFVCMFFTKFFARFRKPSGNPRPFNDMSTTNACKKFVPLEAKYLSVTIWVVKKIYHLFLSEVFCYLLRCQKKIIFLRNISILGDYVLLSELSKDIYRSDWSATKE